MRMRILMWNLLWLIGASLPASAQSLYGPNGLLLHPSPLMLKKGALSVSVTGLPQHYGKAVVMQPTSQPPGFPSTVPPSRSLSQWWLYGAIHYAVSDRLEIGGVTIGALNRDHNHPRPSYGGYVKYLVAPERSGRPAIAAGFSGAGFGSEDTRFGFLSLRKKLNNSDNFPITLDAGALYGDKMEGRSIGANYPYPYGAVEFGLPSTWAFIAEARPRLKGELGQPLGLSLVSRNHSGYQISVSWANSGGNDRPMWGAGLTWQINHREEDDDDNTP